MERAETAARTQSLVSGSASCSKRRKARAAQRKLDASEQESEDSDCILMTRLAHRVYREQQSAEKEEQQPPPPIDGETVAEDEEANAEGGEADKH